MHTLTAPVGIPLHSSPQKRNRTLSSKQLRLVSTVHPPFPPPQFHGVGPVPRERRGRGPAPPEGAQRWLLLEALTGGRGGGVQGGGGGGGGGGAARGRFFAFTFEIPLLCLAMVIIMMKGLIDCSVGRLLVDGLIG
jgi:hypothetical protein